MSGAKSGVSPPRVAGAHAGYALTNVQKEEIVHRITAMFVDYFSEAAPPHTMVLIEEVPDGGYGRADEVSVIPQGHRARE